MHEGTICREIIDIVSQAALENEIKEVYEIVLAVGPYSCVHESQLNFYFDLLKEDTCMKYARILLEKDDALTGAQQIYIKTFEGE